MTKIRWIHVRAGTLVLGGALLLALVSCTPSPPGAVQTLPGLPTLHALDWGFHYVDEATWSPNGRWIALLAGDHVATTHLEVVSPDGRFKQDLSGWGCGLTFWFSFAWRPDNTLGCLNGTSLITGAYPFSRFVVTPVQPQITPQDEGYIWVSDEESLIATSVTAVGDMNIDNGRLYAVSDQGAVDPTPLTLVTEDVSHPAWRPQTQQVSYLIQTDPTTGNLQLMLSSLAVTQGGRLSLSPPTLLANDVDPRYTWSPSGNWVAVRDLDAGTPDRIYLVNPAQASQTVTVVQANQGMLGPIWSPDGQTMIVFSVGYDTSTPYELDIGAYLKSKGLQP